MPLIEIDSLDDPRVQVYRHLKSSPLSRRGGLFIGEGKRVVQRMLDSDFKVASVLISQRRRAAWESRVPPEAPLYVLPQRLAEMLVGFNFHTGVVACGERRPSPDWRDVLDPAARRLTIVACDKVDNPENLGAIVRIASAFGVDAVALGGGCADPFSRRVLRVSMGNVLSMPLIESRELSSDLARLRDEWNVELAAAGLSAEAEPLERAVRPPRFALLFGNEAHGLSDASRRLCAREITIPMQRGTDSLNVAVAAGIFLHHFTRRAD